ncbi:hypothetical protein P0Y35_08595 [Kiritimatiellaeota bacterium B1221]|nr:hypothetical protein [Kiritimatiellaeota bacterium B1221]
MVVSTQKKISGPLVVGVHGIFSLGVQSTDLLLSELDAKGYRTLEIDHGFKPAIFAGITARYYARKLIRQLDGETYVSAVAHSFGARIVLEAMQLGQTFEHIFLFNAAIPADARFPPNKYASITVVANPKDKILKWGKRLLSKLGYGDLGRVGYQGRSPRVVTCTNTVPDPNLFHQHGHAFTPAGLKAWAEVIHENIQAPF